MDEQNGRLTKYNPVPAERKREIIEDALPRILDGHTLEQIATTYGITGRTLHTWLMSLGDEYQSLRQYLIDSKLAESSEAIDTAKDQLQLARAREQFRVASWYAERRDRARYGQQVQVEHEHRHVSFTIVAPAAQDLSTRSIEPLSAENHGDIPEISPSYPQIENGSQ